jgi:RNA polymerase sigma-70 factor, ECF subfamily
MADENDLAEAFEHHRSHLFRVAYATLGSVSDAEDVVQDAWLRLQRVKRHEEIRDLRAWLTTTVARLALDVLGSARARREQYVGPWLPEPLVSDFDPAAEDPADRVTLDESVALALLVVLERLTPPERAAFLLHDVFRMTFEEIAEVVGRSPAATRQLAARARHHIDDGRPRFPPTRAQQLEIATAFALACSEGDLEQLIGLLHPDVVWRTDGGGQVLASRRPQHGASKVARGILALARRKPAPTGKLADINGSPGIVLRDADGLVTVIALTVDAGSIVAIDVLRNPDKLAAVRSPPSEHPYTAITTATATERRDS